MDIQELAEHANSFFVRKQRTEDESFWSLKDRYPEWVQDMVRKAHGGMFPDDYKYEYIVEALDGLEEGRDPDEPELEADIYNGELIAWLASHGERAGYVDEAAEHWGGDHRGGIIGAIGLGQLYEREEVWGMVVQALRSWLEELEMGETEIMLDRYGKPTPKSPKDWSPHR